MPVHDRSQYPLRISNSKQRPRLPLGRFIAGACFLVAIGIFFIPKIITIEIKHEQQQGAVLADTEPFPVSVDANTKSIVENPKADALFQNPSKLTAAVDMASEVINWVIAEINNTELYQSLAATDGRIIVVKAGYRREQVMAQLTSALNWNPQQQQEFLTAVQAQTPGINDGMFAPGTYVVDPSMTPQNVAALMNLAFSKSILLHYGSTTAQHVPLSAALTIASLIEREAGGTHDMRQISGIIWNRLFNNMNLQIDASLQYAKGQTKNGSWWSTVVPKDKYVKSPYNTYSHAGLPPGPIAEPSLAAVLAALNPVDSDCLFYFHDKYGNFHCSKTYAEHVQLLKKYYGQGK